MTAELRTRVLRKVTDAAGGASANAPVLYWMSRDQRVQDNWALLRARDLALEANAPLAVVFCLTPSFPGATMRAYDFMLRGLEEVEGTLNRVGIPFFMLPGDPHTVLPRFTSDVNAAVVVCDFGPMPVKKMWMRSLIDGPYPPTKASEPLGVTTAQVKQCALPACVGEFLEVDTHNIVPCWIASDKLETAARTIRPKITRLLGRFLTSFPAKLTKANCANQLAVWPQAQRHQPSAVDWAKLRETLKVDDSVTPVTWVTPGETAGLKAAADFAGSATKLRHYDESRNDPVADAQSNLSPYLHFGQLSPQRAALLASEHSTSAGAKSFIEEAVIRRELADNYVYYSPDGFHFANWAVETLKKHEADKREWIYNLNQLEFGRTHDDLWNASQHQMVVRGKMHGFLRMYWAKKILEWTPDAKTAFDWALQLNDKYEIDGRDPNGVVGVAWSTYGVHDMGWTERPVFGKIRYMNYNGCKRKFDVGTYVTDVRKYLEGEKRHQPWLVAKCLGSDTDDELRDGTELKNGRGRRARSSGSSARSSSLESSSASSHRSTSAKQRKPRQPAAAARGRPVRGQKKSG
jgi:deoxyribodipyrimidine photo-lyase